MTFFVLAWAFLAFPYFDANAVEVGGRVPTELLGVGSHNILLSAAEVVSTCQRNVEIARESAVVQVKPNADGFFRLSLPRAATWRLTMTVGSEQSEVVLQPWFGPIQIPSKAFITPQDSATRPVIPEESLPLRATNTGEAKSIYFHVVEAGTGSPLPGSVLWIENQPECYTTADENGDARLDLRIPWSGKQLDFRVRAPLHAESSFVVNSTGREETVSLKWAPAYLSGRVFDRSGRAVREAAIRIGHRRESTFTDEHGRFAVPGFAIGRRRPVEIVHEDFRPSTHVLEARTPDKSFPLPILTVWRPRDVSGRVIDEMGRPLTGVSVEARGADGAITGPDGRFLVASVVDDPTMLEFFRQDLVSVALGVELGEGETTLDVGDIVLKPGLRLWGRVIEPGGEPIPEAEVVLADRPKTSTRVQPRRQVVRSDRYGEFIVDGLSAEKDVDVEIRAKGYVPAHAQIRLSGDEERSFMLRPASRLVGTLLDPQDVPLEGSQISIHPSRKDGRPSRSLNLRSGPEGRFIAEGLPPGTAKLGVWAPGFAWHEEEVMITEGEDVEIDVHLVPEAAILGRLTDEAGDAVIKAVVRALGEKTRPGLGDTTDAAGSFYLFGLRPGPLELEVSSKNIRRRFKTFVTPGEQNLEIQLRETDTFSLTGRAFLGPSPLAGIVVRLIETVNGKPRDRVTGRDGAFRFEDLDPTEYVFSFPGESDLVPSAESSSITLRGDVEGWLLEAQRPCSLAGRVVGLTPRELDETVVHLASSSASKTTPVDHLGEFSASGLLPGTWTLTADAVERPRTAISTVFCQGHGEALTTILDFDRDPDIENAASR